MTKAIKVNNEFLETRSFNDLLPRMQHPVQGLV